ncbi:MAG TPA: cytochrome c oxidase subunit II [Gemmatimonadales bacterium]|nr:cytochrome c oxidase subunit II [Gemmatimonadales bacterium]
MSSRRLHWLAAGLGAVLAAGCAGSPHYLRGYGYAADREARLGWLLLIISMLVVLIVTVLVALALWRRRPPHTGQVERSGAGLKWIYWGGIIIPTVVLVGVFIATLGTLAAVATPKREPAVTVEVTGHRWWWEVRYPGHAPSQLAITANEIHVPVKQPVRFVLTTDDVAHSFWIPQLAGKTDLIPGQRNVMWLEADTAGTYWGQCTEYCGLEHANMRMYVVAESQADFDRWIARQRAPAPQQASGAAAGQQAFTQSACALCHTVRGTNANGVAGPDLTHVGGRATIASGILKNTRGNMAGWIANPQALKPGVLMPVVGLSPEQLQSVVTYLQSLQ